MSAGGLAEGEGAEGDGGGRDEETGGGGGGMGGGGGGAEEEGRGGGEGHGARVGSDPSSCSSSSSTPSRFLPFFLLDPSSSSSSSGPPKMRDSWLRMSDALADTRRLSRRARSSSSGISGPPRKDPLGVLRPSRGERKKGEGGRTRRGRGGEGGVKECRRDWGWLLPSDLCAAGVHTSAPGARVGPRTRAWRRGEVHARFDDGAELRVRRG